jgi:hypothetical protein
MTSTRPTWIRWILCACLLAGTGVTAAIANPIDSLAVGAWFQVPNSKLSAVLPSPIPPGATGPDAIMSAWSGGAFDTQRNRLMIWGGGHTDYAGNELYAFNVNTLAWVKLTNPSTDVGGTYTSGYYPDGKPRSRHTYSYLLYVPSMDRFCSFGATAGYPNGTVMGRMVDCFNFGTSQWERKADAPSEGPEGPFAAYDPTTGHVWAHGTGPGAYLTEYNPSSNTWTVHAADNTGWTPAYTCALDWRRRKFVGLGEGDVRVWDLNNPDATAVFMNTTGATSIVGVDKPGFVYDPVTDRFVAWAGGSDVYSLNMTTGVWTRHLKTAGPTPTGATATGTYGRFQYVPSKNVFVAVNAIDEDVYVYKLSSGSGTIAPTDSISPSRPGNLIAR